MKMACALENGLELRVYFHINFGWLYSDIFVKIIG